MRHYWPKRADGLPPGQRLLTTMPRFTDNPLRRPPDVPLQPELHISIGGDPVAHVSGDTLDRLGPRDVRADFHCVTTWSVRGLRWRGVPLRDVLAEVGITEAPAPYVVARAADGCRAVLVWEDLTADDVLLATHLDGAPLDGRHGAPLRLVTPGQYGYKNVKHLVGLDFRHDEPTSDAKMHLRARVAFEERHPRLPARALRLPYRLMIPPTAMLAERSLRRASDAG